MAGPRTAKAQRRRQQVVETDEDGLPRARPTSADLPAIDLRWRQPTSVDLATAGAAEALSRLMTSDPALKARYATGMARVVAAKCEDPLELRRIAALARIASLQALVLCIKAFRGRIVLNECVLEADRIAWLTEAESSLECSIRGEPLVGTALGGTVPRWCEITATSTADATSFPETWRSRTETFMRCDLDLALAPYDAPPALVSQLLHGTEQGCPSWLDAFGLYLAWQLRAKPMAICDFIGCEEADLYRTQSPAVQTVEQAFASAQRISFAFAPYVEAAADDGHDASLNGAGAPRATVREQRIIDGAWVLASIVGCPYRPLVQIARGLSASPLPATLASRLVGEDAEVLRVLVESWRSSRDVARHRAAEALAAGDWDSTHRLAQSFAALPTPEASLEEAATLHALHGQYLIAAQRFGEACETPGLAPAAALRLQLRMADALFRIAGTGGDARSLHLASQAARKALDLSRTLSDAQATCEAAVLLGRLALIANDQKTLPRLRTATGILEEAIEAASRTQGPLPLVAASTRVEALLRIVDLSEVAGLRSRVLSAAEATARSACSWPEARVPARLRGLASAMLAQALFQRATVEELAGLLPPAGEMLERALASPVARTDAALAARLNLALGTVHQTLAEPATLRARSEAAAIAFTRALNGTSDPATVQTIVSRLGGSLTELARGGLAGWRLRQAASAVALTSLEPTSGPPSPEAAGALALRSRTFFNLGALSGDDASIGQASVDAAKAVEAYLELEMQAEAAEVLRAKAEMLLRIGREHRVARYLVESRDTAAASLEQLPAGRDVRTRYLTMIMIAEADAELMEVADTAIEREEARDRSIVSYRKALVIAQNQGVKRFIRDIEGQLRRLARAGAGAAAATATATAPARTA
jgi:hypothetical protein